MLQRGQEKMKLSEIAKMEKPNSKKKEIKLRPAQSSRQLELEYFRALKKLANALKNEIRTSILPLLRDNKKEFQTDSITDQLTAAFEHIKRKAEELSTQAEIVATTTVYKIAKLNRNRFLNSVNNSIGVDLENILQEGNVAEVVKAQSAKSIGQIKGVSDDFMKEVERIVYSGVAEGKRFETIAKEISGVSGEKASTFRKLNNKVKLIARNEVGNISAAINKKRNEELGIETYEWLTSKDERVRDSHKVMEGLTCKWSDASVYLKNGKWVSRASLL